MRIGDEDPLGLLDVLPLLFYQELRRGGDEIVLPGESGDAGFTRYAPDRTHIVTWGERGAQGEAVCIWDGDSGDLLTKLNHPDIRGALWSPKGTWLATFGGDGRVRLWQGY